MVPFLRTGLPKQHQHGDSMPGRQQEGGGAVGHPPLHGQGVNPHDGFGAAVHGSHRIVVKLSGMAAVGQGEFGGAGERVEHSTRKTRVSSSVEVVFGVDGEDKEVASLGPHHQQGVAVRQACHLGIPVLHRCLWPSIAAGKIIVMSTSVTSQLLCTHRKATIITRKLIPTTNSGFSTHTPLPGH